ncbi:MAG: hypothetical protein G3M78_12030 [Candidatus Nitrohelix vancouverensis]|uniref:Uncharacterized protein n=1 Tax=Candidatus Nitrohelix vancouverensis TaxID=2705534 RepID=A0A7T0G474_9BACT|nr:MAG: hypothetical protein G3M78_12030 [Candidatus Nitrohelix vancouverensis]
MDIEKKSSSMAEENHSAGERANSMLNEFQLLTQTFRKALLFKENVRNSLDRKRVELKRQERENNARLQTLENNIRIYSLNTDRIVQNLEELDQKEKNIKQSYEKLLHGSAENPAEAVLAMSEAGGTGAATHVTLDSLIKKRKDYLDNLDKSFKQMDAELLSIETLRQEILFARDEILNKKEKALLKKESILEMGEKISEGLERVDSELGKSINEEQMMTESLRDLLQRIADSMELTEETDRLLFSTLTAAESKNCYESANASVLDDEASPPTS